MLADLLAVKQSRRRYVLSKLKLWYIPRVMRAYHNSEFGRFPCHFIYVFLQLESVQDLPNSLSVLCVTSISVIHLCQRHTVELAGSAHGVRTHFSPA